MKHSLGNGGAFSGGAGLGLEEYPGNQENNLAKHAHVDSSKSHNSPSACNVLQPASCDAEVSNAAVPAPDSKTVVSTLYVSLSDQAHGGSTMSYPCFQQRFIE